MVLFHGSMHCQIVTRTNLAAWKSARPCTIKAIHQKSPNACFTRPMLMFRLLRDNAGL